MPLAIISSHIMAQIPPQQSNMEYCPDSKIGDVLSSRGEARSCVSQCKSVEWIIFTELGHTQPHTNIVTNNKTMEGIINHTIQPKRTKAMDMYLHWLRDHKVQKQFEFKWKEGNTNYAEYATKHHSVVHHREMREIFLTSCTKIFALRKHLTATEMARPPARVC